MIECILSSQEAAEKLGISVATLYDWLSQSDAGELQLRGQSVTIDYFQGGRSGQGRIRIASREVARLLELMRVKPQPRRVRRAPTPKRQLRHITAIPGRPDD